MRKPSKKPLTSSHGGKAQKSSRASVSRAGKPTLWDQASRWYDSLVGMSGSDYHRTILMPGVLRMLELKAGRCVLDLACGQGVLSRYLLQKKLKPEGLDSSEQLLRMARSRSEKSIPYHLGNAGDTAILEGKKFDGVACILAVQNMENIESVLKNVVGVVQMIIHQVVVLVQQHVAEDVVGDNGAPEEWLKYHIVNIWT